MEEIRVQIEKELHMLRQLLETDVTAVAWKLKEDNRLSWWAADGCTDDRYRSLAIRMGRGLEGSVPRIGRPLIIDEANSDTQGRREESPFMRVEQLLAAAVYPIAGTDGVNGVLLAGSRSPRTYSPDNLAVMQLSSRKLNQLRYQAHTGSMISAENHYAIIEAKNGEEASR
ncbi:GAF domain-containing protein [Cohnella lubricantis]|uniref:GAF domain-containing protein n=1 Tax=Cohnella lubricantis TaxID=2163172 RepID=A0A841THB7_9BACL|nr:GAF domain-containing protein [Cohnella lubricantis]MBB6678640.1 GAF domain-containing protein [Cohnella lubricantis]MBP2119200.1 signal transduction protein with GAF and PtsI domain [Cohnella lubricantis]